MTKYITLICLFLITSCQEIHIFRQYDLKLKFNNLSDLDLIYDYNITDSLINFSDPRKVYGKSGNLIKKKTLKGISSYRWKTWEKTLENEVYCTLFIFNEADLIKYSWDEIKSKKLYLKVYKFNLKEIEKDNWTITYPKQ